MPSARGDARPHWWQTSGHNSNETDQLSSGDLICDAQDVPLQTAIQVLDKGVVAACLRCCGDGLSSIAEAPLWTVQNPLVVVVG